MNNTGEYHIPALLKETIDLLNIRPGCRYIDATLGGGGHSEEIILRGGQLLGLDQDPEAINFASGRLAKACPAPPPVFVRSNFSQIGKIARDNNFSLVDGILFDLGVSSHQLETPSRGFSFSGEQELDMRMDPDLGVTAKDLVNALSEKELALIFFKFGEEKLSRRYAKAICQFRQTKPIQTANELAEIILRERRMGGKPDRINPATKVFQALRIVVNDELNSLKEALPQAVELLSKNGRLVVISFHSLEDSIVKKFFLENQKNAILKIINKKPITPSMEEVNINPRSRSAKLRGAEKL